MFTSSPVPPYFPARCPPSPPQGGPAGLWKEGALTFAAARMGRESIVLSETSQLEKGKYCMWDVMNKVNGQNGRRSMATWNSLARAQEEVVWVPGCGR